jgi:CheY-like chemotaxis protein
MDVADLLEMIDVADHHRDCCIFPGSSAQVVFQSSENASSIPVNQKLAIRQLEKRGHRVTVACNGLQALSALENGSFDLVLMDVQIPVMDGLEATTRLREREKASGVHQAVVAMTALVMKGDRERCTWPARLLAIEFTESVRSFQVPATPTRH